MKTFMGTAQNWDGPQIITRILTVEPQRSIAARFIAKKLWTYFAYPNPTTALLDDLVAVFVGSSLDIRTLLRAIFLRPEFLSPTARLGLVRTPVEWIVTVLRSLGMTAVDTNPQWWMEQMGQILFEPPNVAGWKNNAYWLNSTALWARADFARNLTWPAHDAGFMMETTARTPQNQYVMSATAAVDFALTEVRPQSRRRRGFALGAQRARELAQRPASHRGGTDLSVARLGRDQPHHHDHALPRRPARVR